MKFNSIIFHTTRLPEIREFYEGKLKLTIGTYLREAKEFSDHSESYVNYQVGGVLLCFENEVGRSDIGTVVLNVEDFCGLHRKLAAEGLVLGGNANHFKIKDPEGRTLIFEPMG